MIAKRNLKFIPNLIKTLANIIINGKMEKQAQQSL